MWNQKLMLTYLSHEEECQLELGMPCSSLELQESACQHYPCPSTENKKTNITKSATKANYDFT